MFPPRTRWCLRSPRITGGSGHHKNLVLYRFGGRAVSRPPVIEHELSLQAWLARRPRLLFHLTPKSCSWLNAVETLFSRLTRRRLKRAYSARSSNSKPLSLLPHGNQCRSEVLRLDRSPRPCH